MLLNLLQSWRRRTKSRERIIFTALRKKLLHDLNTVASMYSKKLLVIFFTLCLDANRLCDILPFTVLWLLTLSWRCFQLSFTTYVAALSQENDFFGIKQKSEQNDDVLRLGHLLWDTTVVRILISSYFLRLFDVCGIVCWTFGKVICHRISWFHVVVHILYLFPI